MEDTGPLTQAPVSLRFSSDVPGGAKGASIYLDGRTVVDSLAAASLDLIVDAGRHELVVRKNCTAVTPADTVTLSVTGGQPIALDFSLQPLSGLAVVSEPEGLPIWLDGEPTRAVTPATLACVAPGTHTVSVSPSALVGIGFSAAGDTVRSVDLADGIATVRFDLAFAPRPQPRGVLFEIFTSTYCPYCSPADRAATELETDPEFAYDRLSITQIHLYWNGLDPLFNEVLGARADYYRIEPSTSPHAIFNGNERVSGTSYPDIKETYRSRISRTYGRPAEAALYWSDPRLADGRIEGRLRFVAIGDLTDRASLDLCVFYAKDSLRITDPERNPNDLEFVQGARDYMEPIDLGAAGVTVPGNFLDVEVAFELSLDALPSYIDASAQTLRLVAYVQDNTSLEVLQCRQTRVTSLEGGGLHKITSP